MSNKNDSSGSSSKTKSVISKGANSIRNNNKQKELTGATAQETLAKLNHDDKNAHSKIDKIDNIAMLEYLDFSLI